MSRFEGLSIGPKLTLISGLTIVVALALSSLVFLAYDRASVQGMIARRLHSQAEIVAFGGATAVMFGDPDSASRTLAGLQSDPHVIAARILTTGGQLFAEYLRDPRHPSQAPDPPGMDGGATEQLDGDDLVVTRPVLFEGRRLGTLVLRSDLLERDERFRSYGLIVAGVFILALGAALAFGRIAQRAISEPILELAQAARRIADGSDFSVRPFPRSQDEVGALVRAFNHMLDGLQRRDEELRVTHAELQGRIKEADEASRAKDEFLATLSHELRTPLNAILGWAQLLRRGGLDAAAVDQALETISRNTLAQGQIVADILDIQRITAGKLRLNLHALDLAPVVQRAIDTVNPAARAKEIEVQALLDGGVGPVLGDEDRLQQVMWNLLSNAVKFTPKGGRVGVELVKVNSHLQVTVEDTGPGLEPAFIPFVFDRFRQADSSSTRRHGGLGLGLAIVRSLVELHGGSVAAGNRSVGTGALFVVRLPTMSVRPAPHSLTASPPPADSERQVPFERVPSLHGIRILVLDDELDSREITTAALLRCGADVVSVASTREALEFVKRRRPNVILSDVEMPDEDGYSFIRRVRLLPSEEGGGTPAVALAACAGTHDRTRALAAGFQIYVPKPVQPAELAAVVSRLARDSRR